MQMLLIRHGLPIRLASDDGTPADPPLSETGHDQARVTAEWLAAESVDRIYASPMQRARQTAEPLAALTGLPIDLDPRIVEFDAASEEYVPMEELKRADPAAWKEFVTGGYTARTDFDAFVATAVAGLQQMIDDNPGRRIAVFCHGGVINSWATHVLGLPPQLFLDAHYASISRFLAASTGERSIASLNEVAHLRGLQVQPPLRSALGGSSK